MLSVFFEYGLENVLGGTGLLGMKNSTLLIEALARTQEIEYMPYVIWMLVAGLALTEHEKGLLVRTV